MSKCGYACMNCGSCRGVLPKPIFVPRCIECGYDNPFGSEVCEKCGASLMLKPGVTNTVGKRLEGEKRR